MSSRAKTDKSSDEGRVDQRENNGNRSVIKKSNLTKGVSLRTQNDRTEISLKHRVLLLIKIVVYYLTYSRSYPSRLHRYRDVIGNIDQLYLFCRYLQKKYCFLVLIIKFRLRVSYALTRYYNFS